MRRNAATAHTLISDSTTLPLVREGIRFGAVTSRNGPHIQLKPAMIGKIGIRIRRNEMKCDELKEYKAYEFGTSYVYHILEVNEAIAELKAELADKDKDIAYWREEYDKETQLTDALKDEIESLKASHYAEMVDAGMRERRLRRELWLARAERAKEKQQLFYFSLSYDKLCIDGFFNPSSGRRELSPKKWIKVFNKVEQKCRAKAEEYK